MGVIGILIANQAIGRILVKALVRESKDVAQAVKRLPPEAEAIYEEATADLHLCLARLPLAETDAEKQELTANLRHVQSTLDSLDAITKIRTYRATIKALAQIGKIAAQVALAVVI